MKKNLFIGVMSGTSLDGVDIALCSINKKDITLLSFSEFSFPFALKQKILYAISHPITLQEYGTLDQHLGELFAQSLLAFLKEHSINKDNVEAIGLHGQTLWHEPNATLPFSLQLGDANRVSAQTGIKVISDFRRMDMAFGGQGAPFAPAFHQFLFSKTEEKVAIVNIGGMANITLLGTTLLGWDSGLGNVLLDYWIEKIEKKPYDKGGEFAKKGLLHKALLASMLNDAYFKKEPPKSTGREYFNKEWLNTILSNFETISNEDIQRTLLELTAQTILNDLKSRNITTIIICGGGSKNDFLMQRLQTLSSAKVYTSDSFGVKSDAIEAMAFAWLAYKRSNSEVVELKSVTGAKKNALLGAIYG